MQIVYASRLLVQQTQIHWTIPPAIASAMQKQRIKKSIYTPPLIFVDGDDPQPMKRSIHEPEHEVHLPDNVFLTLTSAKLTQAGNETPELVRRLVYEHGPLFEEANQVWLGDPVVAWVYLGRFLALAVQMSRAYEEAIKSKNTSEIRSLLDSWVLLASDDSCPFRIVPNRRELHDLWQDGFSSFMMVTDKHALNGARDVVIRCVETLLQSWWVKGTDAVAGFRPGLSDHFTGEIKFHFVAESLRAALAAHLASAIAARVDLDDPTVRSYLICKNPVCKKIFVSHKIVDYPNPKTCKVYAMRGKVCPEGR